MNVSNGGLTFGLAATSGGSAIDLTSAGTGSSYVGELPGTIRRAILMLCSHWYDGRSAVGSMTEEVAFSVTRLMESEGFGSYA